MKFRKGSKVEVMSKKVVPFSWRCAEIVSGNKFTYSVKYDSYQGSSSEPIVERVSRKAIRPCPPTMEGIVNCEVGDVVEAFGNTSWKIATVSKVLDRDLYLVRLLGTPQEFKVHKSNTRVRQCWQDNTWFVIGKGSGMSEDVISYKLSTPNCYQKRDFQLLQANKKIKTQTGDDCFDVQGNAGLQETDTVSSRMQKRTSPYSSSLLEACAGNVKKIRGIQKEGRHPRSTPVPKREKGHSWRHASIASKGLKMMIGFLPFPWHKQWGNNCIHFPTTKPIHGQPLASMIILVHQCISCLSWILYL